MSKRGADIKGLSVATKKRATKTAGPSSAKTARPSSAKSAAPSRSRTAAAAAPGKVVYPTVPAQELNRLLRFRHPDPHSILGAHPRPEGVVVRAYRPEAEKVELLIGGLRPRPMVRSHSAGIFELLIENRKELFPYRLKVYYAGGNVFTQRDPYIFLPTLSDLDEHLFNEGRHERIYEKLGAHVRKLGDTRGVSFAVWAPHAAGVSVVGNFNNWDGRLHQMRRLGFSGIWEIFIPDLGPGELYKYEIRPPQGLPFLKADPYAFYMESPPATSSVVHQSKYRFHDGPWMKRRADLDQQRLPLSIYEVHHGSWRRVEEEENRPLKYREMAPLLARYAKEMGFTHVEFLPLKEHPYGGSWGYQVGNYYAPSARYGTPDDFRYLVDYLHDQGIGVIMDWVPAHFPKDAFALGRFDGTALYEHADPRQGEHPDWGTYIFNYGRNEVRNFLIANALFWAEEYHVDGLRVDAVASMLYLDYSRAEGQWIPNRHGGRENLEAISLLRELNQLIHARHPGFMMIAEESTSWPLVTRAVSAGGLGFDFKWNMGWMHDTLQYFSKDPIHRQYNHNLLTFGLVYAWSENFILPFSHDEVVHGKGALLNKMPGERAQKFATLRALYGYMWAHPGKKLLFMGGELGQWREWNEERSLDWHLLDQPFHQGLQVLVRDINDFYAEEPALCESDSDPAGFMWIDDRDAQGNTLAFMRRSPRTGRRLVCVCNFAPLVRSGYRVGLPSEGEYRLALNTDAEKYGGTGLRQPDRIKAEAAGWHGQPFSATIMLPPLSTLWLEAPGP
ncbi:MAG TPA: 1,4-alpha-glucan branching protein GlgB [Pyrinomonadaceae bacterium]|jgi:1,4-alpha-glucan branching enzyme